MKFKNIFFAMCVALIIVVIVVSLLIVIHNRTYTKAVSLKIYTTQPTLSLSFDDGYNSC